MRGFRDSDASPPGGLLSQLAERCGLGLKLFAQSMFSAVPSPRL